MIIETIEDLIDVLERYDPDTLVTVGDTDDITISNIMRIDFEAFPEDFNVPVVIIKGVFPL